MLHEVIGTFPSKYEFENEYDFPNLVRMIKIITCHAYVTPISFPEPRFLLVSDREERGLA